MVRIPLVVSLGLGFSVLGSAAACGSTNNSPETHDAGIDAAKPRVREAGADTAPPGYVAQGTRCVRAANPVVTPAFVVPVVDAGAPIVDAGTVDDASDDASLDDADNDSGPADGSAINPAPLVFRPPQVLTGHKPVASLPVIIPITFNGDDLQDEIDDFSASVGCTDYWHAISKDYGVGDAISLTPVHLTEDPPTTISDAQIQTWVRQKITAGEFPAGDGNTIYAIFYPSSKTVVTEGGGSSCSSFGAYHNAVSVSGHNLAYAVMPRCADIDDLTVSASHELIEAATDPVPGGGYSALAADQVAWELQGGGEVGDMCENSRSSSFVPDNYPYAVQRSWSNSAAFLGNDPCVPSDGAAWFAAAPVINDVVAAPKIGIASTNGLKLAVGESKTIDVHLFSAGPTSGWTVSFGDSTRQTTGQSVLKGAFDKNGGNNGDVLKLTITRTGTNSTYGVEPFVIHSRLNDQDHLWFGLVGDE